MRPLRGLQEIRVATQGPPWVGLKALSQEVPFQVRTVGEEGTSQPKSRERHLQEREQQTQTPREEGAWTVSGTRRPAKLPRPA